MQLISVYCHIDQFIAGMVAIRCNAFLDNSDFGRALKLKAIKIATWKSLCYYAFYLVLFYYCLLSGFTTSEVFQHVFAPVVTLQKTAQAPFGIS